MPCRSLSQQSFYDPEFVQPDCLESGTMPWLLARFRSSLFPAWLLMGWRGEGRWGRHAWPAQTLLTLLFLRWTNAGMSRLGSTQRAKTDVCWRAAMGLHMQTQVPDEKTLREFEAFLRERHPSCNVPRYFLIHEHIVRLCLGENVLNNNAIWAMDSTPMWCYGAVLDTVRLLGDGTRTLAMQWAKATGATLHQLAEQWGVPYILAKSTKGHFHLDWGKPDQQMKVLETVVHGAVRAVEDVHQCLTKAPSNRRKRLLIRCQTLLRVIKQDIETDAQGRIVVAQRVAEDRLISLTDPCARHGRKSKSYAFNGFKMHIFGDIVSGLIASVCVSKGNQHDGAFAHRLIRRAKTLGATIDFVLGDTAYGGATLRYRVHRELQIKVIAPPPPTTQQSKDGLSRKDILIDFEGHMATCAAGITTDDHRRVWSKDHQCYASTFSWPKEQCASCSLRQQCCGSRQGGHQIRLHPHEQQLRQARQDWLDPQVRELYRRRSQCERLVNQLVRHGGRQTHGWGLGSAQLQAHLIAMRCNLQLLARALAEAKKLSPSSILKEQLSNKPH
jgi:hypothetical protein